MTALAVLGGIVGVGLLMAFSSIFNGYALSVLWGWFMVPTLGAPALGIVPAIGVAMVVSYLTYQTHDCKKEEKSFGEKIAEGTATAVLNSSFALFFLDGSCTCSCSRSVVPNTSPLRTKNLLGALLFSKIEIFIKILYYLGIRFANSGLNAAKPQ